MKDSDSVKEIIATLSDFRKCSGLKANIEKTHFKYLGSLSDIKTELYNLSPIKGPFTYLGITIGDSDAETQILNMTPRINKLKDLINIWSQRSVSLKGKITIINSVLLPQLIYPITVLSTSSDTTKLINDLLFKFLWSGKPPKIAKDIITNKIEQGGLKMPNILAKFKSLGMTWVIRAFKNPNAGWRHILESYLPGISLEYFIRSKPNENSMKFYIPPIYKQALLDWHDIHQEPYTVSCILHENLWYNPKLNLNSDLFPMKIWYRKGIKEILYIVDENLNFSDTDQNPQ